MAFLLYFVVVVVSVFSVLLEMDVLVKPASKIERATITETLPRAPPPRDNAETMALPRPPDIASRPVVAPAKATAAAPAGPVPVKPVAAASAKPAPVAAVAAPVAAAQAKPAAAEARANPAEPAKANAAETSKTADQPATANPTQAQAAVKPADQAAQALDKPASERCDVIACADAYRSFRESDCTYQPNDGPRRLCTKGTPPGEAPVAAAAGADDATKAAEADAAKPCNEQACADAYISFDPRDCTYQPNYGPRRLCDKK
jgi:BA14K-like protein